MSRQAPLVRPAGFPRLGARLSAAAALALAAVAHGYGPADRVVIVANSDAPDSLAVAEHYARARGVPPANVIALRMPVSETISWREFVATVWQPLEDELVDRGWIDAIKMDLFDDVGRRKYAISGHKIAALVLCRGVPLRVAHDPALYKEVRQLTDHAEFRTNQGSVDSELSLLARTNYPINASVPNPLFHRVQPTDEERSLVVEVSRIDGPTAADAMGLVDRALEAERTGLLGRAYADVAGPHESGNRWIQSCASLMTELGFGISVGHGPPTMPETARFDAPVLYFGWYAQDLNGPFSLPGFRFPPGAIAVHIHSFSAHTMHSSAEGWCGPLVARGVTATVGNVFEPYLEFTHRPDMLLDALARGENLVDAAYFALPVLSWQSIVIGDPLYRPFAVSVSAQMKNLSALPPQLAGYAVIRRMNLLDAGGKKAEAIEAGKAGMREAPNLALALALSARLDASGLGKEAVWMVKDAAATAGPSSGNWEVVREAASFLAAHGRSAEAIDVFRALFANDAIPSDVRSSWLVEARRVALEAGDTSQAAQWREELSRAVEKSIGGNP
ncbi:MAG TPA: TIGR03790 family protein [Opitutaceae bacterium]|nr:TIGR03790 family protein [Opitutaceae bacterium]